MVATLLALALALASRAPALASPARAAASAWFTLEPALAAHWQVQGDATQSRRVTVVSTRKAGRVRRIFVLTSKASPSYTVGLNTILRVFQERGVRASLVDVNFDRQEAAGRAAIAEIQASHPDLVFAIGSEATDYLYRHYKNGAAPVVSAEAKDPVLLGQVKDYETGSGNNFAFTSLNVPVKLQMEYVKRLLPGLLNIGVVYAARNSSSVDTQVKPLLAILPDYGVTGLPVASAGTDVLADLGRAVPTAVATMRRTDPTLRHSILWVVGATEIFSQIRAINHLAGALPVLSAVPDVVAAGEDSAVLAIGTTFQDNAYLAGVYGADILAGKTPGKLPVGVVTPPDIAINFLKAREAHLPIPFDFFETATRVFDARGRLVRDNGQAVKP